jgi:FdhE protein
MTDQRWQRRIRRASQLAERFPFAVEGLQFFRDLAGYQCHVAAKLQEGRQPAENALEELDLSLLLPHFPSFLVHVERIAPQPLAIAAAELGNRDSATWSTLLVNFWKAKCDGNETQCQAASHLHLARLFLQPYAEYLADLAVDHPAAGATSLCPFCKASPQAGVLRAEGNGGKRSLLCSLCATEWPFRRVVCASCGEEDDRKLAVYSAKEFQHLRVEACESCRKFIVTIDMTKEGNAVPLVDELTAVPLGLWAVDHGYSKIHPNLLGI